MATTITQTKKTPSTTFVISTNESTVATSSTPTTLPLT